MTILGKNGGEDSRKHKDQRERSKEVLTKSLQLPHVILEEKWVMQTKKFYQAC